MGAMGGEPGKFASFFRGAKGKAESDWMLVNPMAPQDYRTQGVGL